MKFSAAARIWFAVQLIGTVSGASVSCSTGYGSKSVKHVGTTTKTTQTTVFTTITKVKTTTTRATKTSVHTVTNSSSTYTVPTPGGFVPLTSAGSVQPTWTDMPRGRDVTNINKRAGFARSSSSTAAAAPSYPHDVHCTKTRTKHRKTTVKSTATSTTYVKTVTKTEEVAASTVLAACMADNLLTSFHGRPIQAAAADHALPYCLSGEPFGGSPDSGTHGCLSAYDCCANVVTDGIYSGFSYSPGNCYALAGNRAGFGDWTFYSGTSYGTVFGNGDYAGGVFGGPCTLDFC